MRQPVDLSEDKRAMREHDLKSAFHQTQKLQGKYGILPVLLQPQDTHTLCRDTLTRFPDVSI